jgi:hypothetical protein
MFLDFIDMWISNIKKIKKYYFNIFLSKKHIKKQSLL